MIETLRWRRRFWIRPKTLAPSRTPRAASGSSRTRTVGERLNRPGNGEGLALAAGKQFDHAVHTRNFDAQRVEIGLSQISHFSIVQQLHPQDALVVLAPQEHVVVDTEVADQREILVNCLDAVGTRIAR